MATAVTHRLYAVTSVDLWTPADLWHFFLALMFCLSGAILLAQSEPHWADESQLPHLHHHHSKWQRERSKTGGESLYFSLCLYALLSLWAWQLFHFEVNSHFRMLCFIHAIFNSVYAESPSIIVRMCFFLLAVSTPLTGHLLVLLTTI